MSSWRYAFFFPGPGRALRPEMAVAAVRHFGLEYDSSIRMCLPVDEHSAGAQSGSQKSYDFSYVLEIGGSSPQLQHRLGRSSQHLADDAGARRTARFEPLDNALGIVRRHADQEPT